MAELINLRTARKRALREKEAQRAQANRLTHGQSKNVRALETAVRRKASQDLDGHRMDKGDDR